MKPYTLKPYRGLKILAQITQTGDPVPYRASCILLSSAQMLRTSRYLRQTPRRSNPCRHSGACELRFRTHVLRRYRREGPDRGMAPGRDPRRQLAHGRTRTAQEALHCVVGLDNRPKDRRAPELELLPPQRVACCPLGHALHGHTRTAQEARHGIVGLDDGAEGQRAPELQLIPADIVMMHGKHLVRVRVGARVRARVRVGVRVRIRVRVRVGVRCTASTRLLLSLCSRSGHARW